MSTSKWTTFSCRFRLLGLNSQFCPPIFSQWLGRQIFLDDLSSFDPDLYNGFVFFKHYTGDLGDLSLNFTMATWIGAGVSTWNVWESGVSCLPSRVSTIALKELKYGLQVVTAQHSSKAPALGHEILTPDPLPGRWRRAFLCVWMCLFFMNICNMNTVFLLSKYHGR